MIQITLDSLKERHDSIRKQKKSSKGSCAYYRLRNQYEGGQYTLCQCLQKTPNMLNKCLEYWYNHR